MEVMTMTASNIFYVVLSIVSVLVTGVLVPLLRQKYGREKVLSAMDAVDIAVKAAEVIFKESSQGDLKKKYVLMRLNEKGFKITEKDLDEMRKASVLELNKWKEEINK